jgi:hypothetical protein
MPPGEQQQPGSDPHLFSDMDLPLLRWTNSPRCQISVLKRCSALKRSFGAWQFDHRQMGIGGDSELDWKIQRLLFFEDTCPPTRVPGTLCCPGVTFVTFPYTGFLLSTRLENRHSPLDCRCTPFRVLGPPLARHRCFVPVPQGGGWPSTWHRVRWSRCWTTGRTARSAARQALTMETSTQATSRHMFKTK